MRRVDSVVEKNEKSGRFPCSRREVNLSKMCWQRQPDARDRQDKCSSFKSAVLCGCIICSHPQVIQQTYCQGGGGIHGGAGGEGRIQSVTYEWQIVIF